MANEPAWKDVVAGWRQTLDLGSRQGGWIKLLLHDDEQLLVDVLTAATLPDELRAGSADAVDEALAEAAAYTRQTQAAGHEKFAAWCTAFRRGQGTPDPLARTTIEASIALVRPPGAAEEPGLGTLAEQLFDLLRDGDANVGPWGLYAAGMAALALRHGWGPSRVRTPESRASWGAFAWLLACVAWVLLRRARRYDPASQSPEPPR